MAEESIEVDVQLEFEDFWRVLFWKTLKRYWHMYFLTFAISLPAIVIFFYVLLTNPERIKFSPAILLLLLPLLTVLIVQWSIYTRAKKSDVSLKSKARWVFYRDEFDVFTPVSRSENSWESLVEVEEESKNFLLFLHKDIFMIIPKRFFESDSQIQEFRELVRENLGDRAKLKR